MLENKVTPKAIFDIEKKICFRKYIYNVVELMEAHIFFIQSFSIKQLFLEKKDKNLNLFISANHCFPKHNSSQTGLKMKILHRAFIQIVFLLC